MDIAAPKIEQTIASNNTSSTGQRKLTIKKKRNLLNRVPVLDLVLSIKNLSIMLKSTLALEDCLKILSEQTTNKNLRESYLEILKDIRSGYTLSESMSQFPNAFPDIVISIIRAGEQGGTLEKNLIYLAEYLKKDYELKKKIKGALFYPFFILGFTVLEMLGVLLLIIPKLDALFSTFPKIPPFTKFIMNLSRFIIEYKFILLGVIIVAVILLQLFLKSHVGDVFKDKLALKAPIFKKLKQFSVLSNFSRTLGILLDSGIPLTAALEIASTTVGSFSYSAALKMIQVQVKSGQTLSASMSKYPKLFPGTFIKLIEVGEKTGALQEDLIYLNEFYSAEVDDLTANMTQLLEPILLIFIGAGIGGLALSIVVPIYQLTGSINEE